ncbi:MAG: hypothetical protein MN733_44110 [Nitrososphaera sp.]|nr:hypothetical protein [Nitrososphaera sp.]
MSNLPLRFATGKSVQLHDNGLKAGSLIEQSIANLTKEQAQNLMMEAGKTRLDLEKKALQQDLDYEAGSKDIEAHLDTVHRLPRGELRHDVRSNINTGSGHMTIESSSRGPCFVATTAYGDRNHPDVVLLRKFRDEVLVNSSAGRRFIDWYWRAGPYLARGISHSPRLRYCSRWLISCLVFLTRKHF